MSPPSGDDRAVGLPTLAVIGDSQVGDHWRAIEHEALLPELRLRRCSIDGATAFGTINGAMPVFHENVETLAHDRYARFLDEEPTPDAVCVVLGGVDCHIWAWNESQRTGEPAPAILERSLERLTRWCGSGFGGRLRPSRILITGAILPPLKDENRPRVRHVRMRNVRATQREITAETLVFNAGLQAEVARIGCHYLDITRETFDADTGLVHEAFCADDPLEHHLSTARLKGLWADKVRAALPALLADR